jgi:hypothetical protein
MRGILRRIVMEDTAEQWEDSDLNTLLDTALASFQEYVMLVDPEAFMEWQTANIVVDQRYYVKPASIHHEIELGYSSDPTTNAYIPMKREDYAKVREYESRVARGSDITLENQGTTITNNYASVGRYWYLGWSPDTAITDGLQTIFVPVLSMAADATVPPIHLNLHYGIVLEAAIMAFEETPEDTTRLERHRDRIVAKIPQYYRKSGSGQETLRVDLGHLGKDY